MKGQLSSVEAQFRLSEEQNQFASGQHPVGHSVPDHCFSAAIFISRFLATAGGHCAWVGAYHLASLQQARYSAGQQPLIHYWLDYIAFRQTSWSPGSWQQLGGIGLGWESTLKLPHIMQGTGLVNSHEGTGYPLGYTASWQPSWSAGSWQQLGELC